MKSLERAKKRGLLCAVLLAGVVAWCGSAAAGEDRPTVNPYSGYDNDAAGMLDAINRNHGTPAARPPVVRRYPDGSTELNPYNSWKYRYDSVGMIDAIDRDFPRTSYPSQTGGQ